MFDFTNPAVYLSWIIFLPAVAALVISLLPMSGERIKQVSLGITAVVFIFE